MEHQIRTAAWLRDLSQFRILSEFRTVKRPANEVL